MGMGAVLGFIVSHPFSNAATYVKVYLLENGVCLAKKKTKAVKKTCDPSYQQPLLFEESPQGKVLQVMCPHTDTWGQGGIRGVRTGHHQHPLCCSPARSLPIPIAPNSPSFPPKLALQGSSPNTSSAPQVTAGQLP